MVVYSSLPVVLRWGRHQGVHLDGRGRRSRADQHRPCAPSRARPEPGLHGRGERDRVRGRLRARDGMRLPGRVAVGRLRSAGDQSRDHPRLRRHAAAAAAGRPLEGARDEPDRDAVLAPEARFHGLADDLVPDEELFDTALAWARKLAGQAPSLSSRSRRSPTRATWTRGSRPRSKGSQRHSCRRTARRESPPSFRSVPRSGAGSGGRRRSLLGRRLASLRQNHFWEPSSHDSVAVHSLRPLHSLLS